MDDLMFSCHGTYRRQAQQWSRKAVRWHNCCTAGPAGSTKDHHLVSLTVECVLPCKTFTETFCMSHGTNIRYYATSCDIMAYRASALLQPTMAEMVKRLYDPRRLWMTPASTAVAVILSSCKAPTTADIDASVLHHLFDDKVARVCGATARSPHCSSSWCLSATSSHSFGLSCQQMSSWFKHFQTNSAPQILYRHSYWKFMQMIWCHFSVGFSVGHCSMELFYQGISQPSSRH